MAMKKEVCYTSCGAERLYWIGSEAAFFGFLYYAQFLLGVQGNLWWSSFVLWLLMNISILACPVVRRCYK